MKKILRRHHISFMHAWDGIVWAFKTQPNFKVHMILSSAALVLAVILEISRIEYAIVIFTILLGLAAEMINTSIEAVTDLVSTEWREYAKISKDVSAGMMLVVSFGAVCIAAIIFLPYFFI